MVGIHQISATGSALHSSFTHSSMTGWNAALSEHSWKFSLYLSAYRLKTIPKWVPAPLLGGGGAMHSRMSTLPICPRGHLALKHWLYRTWAALLFWCSGTNVRRPFLPPLVHFGAQWHHFSMKGGEKGGGFISGRGLTGVRLSLQTHARVQHAIVALPFRHFGRMRRMRRRSVLPHLPRACQHPTVLHDALHAVAFSRSSGALTCAYDQVVFACDGGEGGGVSEPAPMRAPLEAWPRSVLMALMEQDGWTGGTTLAGRLRAATRALSLTPDTGPGGHGVSGPCCCHLAVNQ